MSDWTLGTGFQADDMIVHPKLMVDAIHFDSTSGATGTVWPYGFPGYAVNDIDDADTLATNRLVNKILVRGQATPSGNMTTGHEFVGMGYSSAGNYQFAEFNPNGKIIQARFRNLEITGNCDAQSCITYESCYFGDLTSIGYIIAAYNCIFDCHTGLQFTAPGPNYILKDCTFGQSNVNTVFNFTGANASNIWIVGGSGQITLTNITLATVVINIMNSGIRIIRAASCTTGTINLYGTMVRFEDSGTGATVNRGSVPGTKPYITATDNVTGDIEQNDSTGDFNATQKANFTTTIASLVASLNRAFQRLATSLKASLKDKTYVE